MHAYQLGEVDGVPLCFSDATNTEELVYQRPPRPTTVRSWLGSRHDPGRRIGPAACARSTRAGRSKASTPPSTPA